MPVEVTALELYLPLAVFGAFMAGSVSAFVTGIFLARFL